MICPHCKKEIERVRVYSEVYCYANVDKDGKITHYGPIEDNLGTIDIEHAGIAEGHDCYGKLNDIVREG